MSDASAPTSRTANADEIARFSAMSEKWWDPNGVMKPLHKFNPVRLQILRDNICAHLGRDPETIEPLKGIEIIDIGCGAGLLSEPLARMGAKMTSIDASESNIEVAKIHAAQSGLEIDYRCATPEMLADEGKQFDIVLNMEVIEHVDDPQFFMQACASVLKPGGLMFCAGCLRAPMTGANLSNHRKCRAICVVPVWTFKISPGWLTTRSTTHGRPPRMILM